MKAILTRHYYEDATLGQLQIEGIDHNPLFTIELPWKNNEHDVSCIPTGTYDVEPFNWENSEIFHHKSVYRIHNVPDRTGIDIHIGNLASDLLGCLAVGLTQDMVGGLHCVTKSGPAMNILKSIIGQNSWVLEIK